MGSTKLLTSYSTIYPSIAWGTFYDDPCDGHVFDALMSADDHSTEDDVARATAKFGSLVELVDAAISERHTQSDRRGNASGAARLTRAKPD